MQQVQCISRKLYSECNGHLIKEKALQMQRNRATWFVSRNYKSDRQAHSRLLVFMPFHRWYMISY